MPVCGFVTGAGATQQWQDFPGPSGNHRSQAAVFTHAAAAFQ
ncbi:MAG TPA: hypothetical protein QGE93_03195 [Acidobacteriota bacterium]|nr:hypothetical protein [Acidobacteriota bacterium]|tara:strand:- start:504 stop:629 length:126 start_codon:yes stop_codon:yes gene_type:complete